LAKLSNAANSSPLPVEQQAALSFPQELRLLDRCKAITA
jgi:hypothetical protein